MTDSAFMFGMKFSEKFRRLMKSRGTTKAEVSRALGYTQQTVGKYASGKARPNLQSAVRLCKVLDCDLLYLLDDEADDEPVRLKSEQRVVIDELINRLGYQEVLNRILGTSKAVPSSVAGPRKGDNGSGSKPILEPPPPGGGTSETG